MSNCDFASPCLCSRCTTASRTDACPHCSFPNVVSIKGGGSIGYDRKGMRGASISHDTGPRKALACRSCRAPFEVEFYSSVDERECARNLEAQRIRASAAPCAGCSDQVEYAFPSENPVPVVLTKFEGRGFCKNCLWKQVRASLPDPSDDDHKFEFSRPDLKWVLSKVRKRCAGCGRRRWLNAENAWQSQCRPCYDRSVAA